MVLPVVFLTVKLFFTPNLTQPGRACKRLAIFACFS